MRLLLDEMLSPRFCLDIERAGHEASAVTQIGWAGVKNGELLRRAHLSGFQVLVTRDRGIEHQQNIRTAGIGVIVLIALSNRVEDLRPLLPALETALARIRPGQVILVGGASGTVDSGAS